MDSYAYNKYDSLPLYSYNCISYLVDSNEDIWKLLKYSEADCWNKPNLTRAEKTALIYNGEPDESVFKVFMDEGQIDAFVSETALLRIFPYAIFPDNRTIGTVTMAFDIYSHYRVNHMSNYQTRVDTMCQIILEVFNGTDIGGLGKLFFNIMGDKQLREYPSGQIPYKGKRISMATKAG